MIRLIYRHYCDRCHTVIAVQEFALSLRAPIPNPSDNHQYAGMHLCDPCTDVIRAAIREVMV